jgi:hypothetical protein
MRPGAFFCGNSADFVRPSSCGRRIRIFTLPAANVKTSAGGVTPLILVKDNVIA